MNFNIGDIVSRKSYNNDIIFQIIDITDNIVTLKGVDLRLLADSPVNGEAQQGTENTANTENNNITSIAQSVAANCSKSVVGIRTTTSVISFFGGTSEATAPTRQAECRRAIR